MKTNHAYTCFIVLNFIELVSRISFARALYNVSERSAKHSIENEHVIEAWFNESDIMHSDDRYTRDLYNRKRMCKTAWRT